MTAKLDSVVQEMRQYASAMKCGLGCSCGECGQCDALSKDPDDWADTIAAEVEGMRGENRHLRKFIAGLPKATECAPLLASLPQPPEKSDG